MAKRYEAIELQNLKGVLVSDDAKAAMLVLARHGDIKNARKAAFQVITREAQRVYESASQSSVPVRGGVGDSRGGWTVTAGKEVSG